MSSKLTEKDFIKMANKIYIEPTKEVLNYIKDEFLTLEKQFQMLKKINVEQVEPLTRISQPITLLREDEVDNSVTLSKDQALANAKEKNKDYILIKRIISK